jgi:hypothetical protein
MNNNGLVIQSLSDKEDFAVIPESISSLEDQRYRSYRGIGRYISWPLEKQTDSISKELTSEATERWFYRFYNEDSLQYALEVVPDLDYCVRYLRVCHDKGIKVRVLFCTTERNYPFWEDSIPEGVFLGYDYATSTDFYSTIPDDMLLDASPPILQTFRTFLNSYKLFNRMQDLNSYISKRQDSVKAGAPIEDFGDFCIFHISIVTQELLQIP